MAPDVVATNGPLDEPQSGFENLLTQLAKQRGWLFIPLLTVTGKRIIPDGTVRDPNGLVLSHVPEWAGVEPWLLR
jgi:hypothetical protein